MTPRHDNGEEKHPCGRCGGLTVYRAAAVVPGNPLARRGSRSAEAHPQPAWECLACGHLEPHDRRTTRSAARRGA